VRLNLQLEEQLRKSFAALGKKRLYRAGLSTTGQRPGYACLFQELID
jgi:hypothetical protein